MRAALWVAILCNMACFKNAQGFILTAGTHHVGASRWQHRDRLAFRSQNPHSPSGFHRGLQMTEGGTNLVDKVADFAITSLFKSSFYVGSEELHLPLPLPEEYPAWFPASLRMPSFMYKLADAGVEAGVIKRTSTDDTFAIRFGLLRSIASKKQQTINAFDQTSARKLQQQAAAKLQNIGSDERYRRGDVSPCFFCKVPKVFAKAC